MDEPIPDALLPVLRDLRATCGVRPDLREETPLRGGERVLMLFAPDGSGVGLRLGVAGGPAEQVADLADQAQEWAVEALWGQGLPAVWPECPEHPGTHPLAATVVDGVATWSCPHTRAPVAAVGRL
ncbi:hypothetical protein ABT158_26810 [Nonomuraea sp. NPDC001636]|uniref:hypothetical protein n=1 Tax=Nonomuraea sp. NPDC001636 TaxID=3154391 RepID=UPI00331E5A0E